MELVKAIADITSVLIDNRGSDHSPGFRLRLQQWWMLHMNAANKVPHHLLLSWLSTSLSAGERLWTS